MKLEEYIKSTLKQGGSHAEIPGWGEVKMLLRKEPGAVRLPDKKYILSGAAAALLALCIFLIAKFGGSEKEEEKIPVQESAEENWMIPVEEIVSEDTFSKVEAAEHDSAIAIASEKDSISEVKKEPTQAVSTEKEPSAVTELPKKEKKLKISKYAPVITDSSPEPELIVPEEEKPEEPKEVFSAPESLRVLPDTSGAPGKKKKSKKKS